MSTKEQEDVRKSVIAAERAFANSMAERKFEAFAKLVSQEAIFFNTPIPLRGKEAVLAWWSKYFDSVSAPFSWEPDQVEVVSSGTLAFSSGPVRDPSGIIIGRFNSIWRLEDSGQWRVVFDKGSSAPTPTIPLP